MTRPSFGELLDGRWEQDNFPCVGLDSSDSNLMKAVVDETHDLVGAYKPNSEPYFGEGPNGYTDLRRVIAHIHQVAPDVPVILDRKAGDIGSTNEQTVKMAFDYLGADAITVSPYAGKEEGLEPFFECKNKGIIVLCRTSNKGAGDLQDLPVRVPLDVFRHIETLLEREIPEGTVSLYQYVAYLVSQEWNQNNNCALVVGAQYPEELKQVRKIVGDMPILVPGLGFQQKDVPLSEQVRLVVENGRDSRRRGIIPNSSRGIIRARDPRAATMEFRNLINQYR